MPEIYLTPEQLKAVLDAIAFYTGYSDYEYSDIIRVLEKA